MELVFEIRPFDHETDSQVKQAYCDHLIREVSGRRQVFEGRIDKKNAIVKVFQSQIHKKRHFLREFRGFKELSSRKLETAVVLAGGQTQTGQYILALEKINHTDDLLSYTQNAENPVDSQNVLIHLFEYLGKMHQAGVMQYDLHLGNFLWDGKSVFALDPAEMNFSSKPVSCKNCIRQLALLFANQPESFWINKKELLQAYFRSKNSDLNDSIFQAIEKASQKQRAIAIKRFLRKSLRTSKHHIKTKQKKFMGVFQRTLFEQQDIKHFMSQLDDLMRLGKILKEGNTCFVSLIKINNKPIVAKRYNHKNWWHSFRHTIKRSRARHCWLFGNRLKMLEIPSAEPVAYIERRKNGIIHQSYILNEYIDGPQLYDIMHQDKYQYVDKTQITGEVDHLLNNLIRSNLTHGDMKPNNILIHEGKPILIDLDSMKYHRTKWTLRFYGQKMLTQFRNRLNVKKY